MKVYSHIAVVHGSHAGKSKSYLFTLTILIQLAFQGFVIRPGHENLVAMGAVSTIADDEIISVPAKKRNCYFQEEYKLELHRWVMEMLVVWSSFCSLGCTHSLDVFLSVRWLWDGLRL